MQKKHHKELEFKEKEKGRREKFIVC